jgi:adenine-specific DNA-methyltransferase
LQFANIELNSAPDFKKLCKYIENPFVHLNSIDVSGFQFNEDQFVARHFSPFNGGSRKYFTEKNGLHIDAIRQTINYWRSEDLISQAEQQYLIASLIEAVPSVSNIAGTYGAYLKHWDPRTSKNLELKPFQLIDNNENNSSHNEDANELINKVSGEILYLDPPYNGRQYLGNYHVLETIAKYDSPALSGVTGTRKEDNKSSDFCKKSKVASSFTNLIDAANFKNILISYSTEGILDIEELISITEKSTNKKKLEVYKIPYRRYSRIKDNDKPEVQEIIISAVK